MTVCLSVCVSVAVCLSVCASVCLCICLSVTNSSDFCGEELLGDDGRIPEHILGCYLHAVVETTSHNYRVVLLEEDGLAGIHWTLSG